MEKKFKTGGFFYLMKIAYRNIYRNFRRSILCFIAIGIAVFFMVFMAGYLNGMLQSMNDTVQTFITGHVTIYTKDYDAKKDFYPVQYPVEFENKTADEFITELRGMEGVKAVFPRISSFATLTDSNVKHAILWGIDTQNEFKVNNFNLKNKNNGLLEGRYPLDGENGCAIGKRLAEKMGVKIGDKIPLKTISSQFSDKFWNPVITGIFDYDFKTADENYIIVSFNKLQKILNLSGKTQSVMIYLNDYSKSSEVKKLLSEKLKGNENLVVKQWKDHIFVALMEQSQVLINIAFMVFIIVASFLIINTVLMVIHERIKEIGMMGALGMNRREIVQVFFFEAVFLSIIGSLFGIFVGGFVIFGMSFYPIDLAMFTGGGMEMPLGNTLFVKFSPLYLVQSFLFGVIVSSVCTLFPSLKSAFVEPVEALRR